MRNILFFLVVLLAAIPARAQPELRALPHTLPHTLDVRYALSFWGVTFGHIQYSDTLKEDTYSARAHFETQGLVGFFWKSIIDATADGSVDAHGVSPAVYDSYSRYRDRPLQRVKLTYANGEPSVLFDPPMELIRFPVSKEQQKGAIDPMSALISILTGANASPKAPCGTGAQVFDGRRRYDVTFTFVKDETLGVGPYQGSAHLCELHFVPIAGYPQRLIMERRNPPKMFADFVDVAETGTPHDRYVMPVKVWAELEWGTVTAALDSVTMDDATPVPFMPKG